MTLPNFVGLANACVIVDDIMETFDYNKRILGTVHGQCIPNYRNKGFFKAAGLVKEVDQCTEPEDYNYLTKSMRLMQRKSRAPTTF